MEGHLMLPLEVSILPKSVDTITVYVDGRKKKLNNNLFVMDQLLYAPVYEMSALLNFFDADPKHTELRYDDEQSYWVRESYILESRYDREDLDYSVKSIDETIFIDVLFFVREIGVSVAWEGETSSVYFATVPCFDGYMIVPKHFDRDVSILSDYGRCLCADGSYLRSKNGKYEFDLSGVGFGFHRIIFNNYVEGTMEKRVTKTLCFQLEGIDKENYILFGRLLETYDIYHESKHKLGNMEYTDTDWVLICKRQPGFANLIDHDGRISKEALYTIFSEYPYILRDRNVLDNWLKTLFFHNERERNLLLTAYDNDIFGTIAREDNQLDDCFVHDLAQRLIRSNGIALKYAWDTVCLCCEVYGRRIKGKNYVQKEKYNEKFQNLIMYREEKWVEPNLSEKGQIGKGSYLIPQGWRCEEGSDDRGGVYFYPYDDHTGQIYLYSCKYEKATLYEEFDFDSYFASMANGDSNNIISITEYVPVWSRIKGKKANMYLKVYTEKFEMDVYCFPVDGYIYTIFFGEETVLTDKMQRFEEKFLKYFSFGVDTNTKEETPDWWGWEPEPPSMILTLELDELELSARIADALKKAGITKVLELANMTSYELMQVPDIGQRSYEEIVDKLDELGLSLREE